MISEAQRILRFARNDNKNEKRHWIEIMVTIRVKILQVHMNTILYILHYLTYKCKHEFKLCLHKKKFW